MESQGLVASQGLTPRKDKAFWESLEEETASTIGGFNEEKSVSGSNQLYTYDANSDFWPTSSPLSACHASADQVVGVARTVPADTPTRSDWGGDAGSHIAQVTDGHCDTSSAVCGSQGQQVVSDEESSRQQAVTGDVLRLR